MLRLPSWFLFFVGLLAGLLPCGACHGQNALDCEGQYARATGFSHTFYMPTSRVDSVSHRLWNNALIGEAYFFSALPEPAYSPADTIQLFIIESAWLPERLDKWVTARYGKLCPTHIRRDIRSADPFAPERSTFVMVKTARFFRKIKHGPVAYWQYSLAGKALYLGATHFSLPNPRYLPWFHKRERAFFHLPVKVYYVLVLN